MKIKKLKDSSTIFTDNFPEDVTSSEELEKFQKEYSHYDDYYVTSGCVKSRREYFDSLWIKFKLYADRNFLSQIKLNFHQRSWEMYIGVVLLDNGFELKNPQGGPDFIVNDSFYLECVAVTKGAENSNHKVPNFKYNTVNTVPINRILYRLTNAIQEKFNKYSKQWSKQNWFDKSKPFIIALNSGAIEFPTGLPNGCPIVVKVLFGVGDLSFPIKVGQNPSQELGEPYFGFRNQILKGQAPIDTAMFFQENYNFVTGVIFSDHTILNITPKMDNLWYVPNLKARNPIQDDTFPGIEICKLEKRDHKYILIRKGSK